MKKQVVEKVVEKICNRMCLDYSYYLAVKANPERALDDLYEERQAKEEIVKLVNKSLNSKLDEWWENRTRCCCSAVAYEPTPDEWPWE
jgi:hypothetical protein